jgi:hypothetical protein
MEADPLLSAPQIAARLPSPQRQGTYTCRQVRSWMDAGLHGVKLRYEPVGGRRMARMSWVKEFFQRVDRARAAWRERLRRQCREVT